MTRSENDGRIDYIEMGVRDLERAKKFYGDVFGWTFRDYGPTYAEFFDGRLRGGFTTEMQPGPGGPLVVFYGDNLAAMQDRIEAAGGQIIKAVFDFPGGQRFHFTDPDGYEMAVWTKV